MCSMFHPQFSKVSWWVLGEAFHVECSDVIMEYSVKMKRTLSSGRKWKKVGHGWRKTWRGRGPQHTYIFATELYPQPWGLLFILILLVVVLVFFPSFSPSLSQSPYIPWNHLVGKCSIGCRCHTLCHNAQSQFRTKWNAMKPRAKAGVPC